MPMQRPFRLRVMDALQSCIEGVTIANGYQHDLAGVVFVGRAIFGDDDPVPMVAILEPPTSIDQLPAPVDSTTSEAPWDILIQGFVRDDKDHPTVPAYMLCADVKRALALEKQRKSEDGRTPNILGLGGGRGLGNEITGMTIGAGICRPPDQEVGPKAYFWLPVTLEVVEDMARPFV